MNPYRIRILSELRPLLTPLGLRSALDVGAGDGWFASRLAGEGLAGAVTALDVKLRDGLHHPVACYPGGALPYPDRSFDLVYAMDVLHHCEDPPATLREMARVAAGYVLIKDHTYSSAAGRFTLSVLDELGNRRFGIPSPRNYQKRWSWFPCLEENGFRRLALLHPVRCHVGPLGLTNPLQFIGLWRRG